MSPFNPKSWFNRRFRQNPPEATAQEDQQQTFILEPIYTPSGLLDGGDDSDGLDLGPVDEPMDDFSDALSPDGESDVPGDDGDNIGDEGDLDIEEEDILPEGEEGVNYLDDEYIPDDEIGETIPYAGDDEVETTEPSDSTEEVENALEDDSDIPDDDGEINNEEELTDEESPESQEDSEEDDGNDDDVKNEVEDNPDDEGNDDDVKNEVEDNPDDDTENLGDDDNSGETDEEAADVENDEEGESETDDDDEDELEEDEEDNPLAFDVPEFNSGIFQVGASGEVGVDFLFDGGAYQGEVAFFSLAGFDELEFNGIEDFIAEAAQRAASGSEQGHIVIRVADEGARFTGSLFGEPDWNTGVYQGVKTFNMTPGDEFGVMLVPNGRVSEVLDNPSIGGAKRPLFSLASTNPKEGFHLGQIADLTGDGNTFVFEDKRVEVSDWDYDDVIFQIRGAVGDAVHVENVIAPDLDWRQDDLGKALLAYSKPYLATSEQLDLVELVAEDPDGLLNGDDGMSPPDSGNPDLDGEDLDDADLDEVEETDALEEADDSDSQESQSDSDSADEDEAVESSGESDSTSGDSSSNPDSSSTSGGNETVSERQPSTEGSEMMSGGSSETVTEGDVSEGSESPDEVSEAQQEPVSEEPVSEELVSDNPVSENEVDEFSNGSSEETADSQAADPLVTAAQGFEFAKEDQPLVGIIDTGFAENNPDLNYDNFILGRDWVDGDDNPLLAPGEGSEHGTHLLGLIAAQQDNGIGIDGINPEAPVWLGRGVGSGEWASSLVEFVDAAAESGQANAVVNLSLDLTEMDAEGNVSPRYELTVAERTAIEYARQQGVLLVVAAGNDGGNLSALAQASREFDNVLTVGAAEAFDPNLAVAQGHGRAEYSNFGTGLGLLAPGGTAENPVLSTVGDDLGTLAGTSVATARVTGATSLVWAANPELSYRQVIEILQTTATDLGTPNWNPDTGAGLLNLLAAVHLAKATKPQAYDPTPIEIGETPRRRHIVRPGETPAGLAEEELGDEEAWVEITDSEGNPFESPDEPLVPGTEVELPMYGGGVVNPQVESPAREPQPLTPANQAPEDLQVSLSRLYNPGETIRLSGWVSDADGAEDLERVEFWLRQDGGDWVEVGETSKFAIDPNHPDWGGFEQELSGLTPGQYELRVIPADQDGQVGEAVTQTFTVLSVPEGQHLSERVKRAITQAMKLEAYHPDILALTEQWVVSVRQGESPDALAAQVGATNLGPTNQIPNTYVWKFDGDSDPYEIAAAMDEVIGIEFAYPLVNFPIEFYSTPWHLENTGQTGGQPGVDARVKLAWQDHGVSGEGATIGFLDSGFDYEHPNLSANYQAHLSYDFDEDNSYPSYTFSTQVTSPESIVVLEDGGSETVNIVWDERLSHRVFKGYLSNLALTLPGIDVDDEASLEDIEISLISPWETEFKLTDLESGSKSYFTDVFNGENPNEAHQINRNNFWRLLIDNQSPETIIIDPNWSIDFDLVDAHGTQVAGAAIANSETGNMGVAPGANWAGLRVGSDFINDGSLAKALSHKNQNIDIYNNSWGVSFRTNILPQALYGLEAGSQNGRNNLGNLFVFAAGNEGHNGDDVNYNPLANSRYAIAVGAVDQSGRKAVYSNPGAPLLLSAPSENSSYLASRIDTPKSIPVDGSTLSLELGTVEGVSDLINRVEVNLGIEHDKYEDLEVTLVQVTPEGEERRVQLLADVPFTIENYLGREVRNLSISLADNAARDLPDNTAPFHGRFRPQESLDIFKGQDVNGTWKIEIKDRHTQNLSGSVHQAAVALSTTGIATTDIQGEAGTTSGNFTNEFGGTSAAAPIVSGVIALMLEVNPQLSWRDIQHILVETANREAIQDADADWSGSPGDSIRHSHQYGFGMVDAEAAVAAAKTWKPVGPEVSVEIPGNLALSDRLIPDNDPEGVSSSVTVDEEFTVEWVEVDFRSSHDDPDNLRLELVHTYTTEEGEEKTTVSTLARPYQSSVQNYYNDWWFSSARHWGEPVNGTWTLRVSDETDSGKDIGGIWDDWSLILHGTTESMPEFGEPFQVNTYDEGDQRGHLIAKLSDGGFIVTWNSFDHRGISERDSEDYGIYAQRYDRDGYPVSSEFKVNNYSDANELMAGAMVSSVTGLSDGGFIILWGAFGEDGHRVYGQRYDKNNNPVGNEFKVNSPEDMSQRAISATELSNGNLMVTWQQYPDDGSGLTGINDDHEVLANFYDVNGNIIESNVDLMISDVYRNEMSITPVPSGGFWTTWTSLDNTSPIYAQRYDNHGSKIGSKFRVNTSERFWLEDMGPDSDVSISILHDESFVISWHSYSEENGVHDVYAQRYDKNGNPVGSEFTVNTYTNEIKRNPSVSSLDGGGFIITWGSERQDSSERSIYGQKYDVNGQPIGEEFKINPDSQGHQRAWRPSVIETIDGRFVVVWTSNHPDDSTLDIFGRMFEGVNQSINTPPLAPNNLSSSLSDETVTLTWDAATDTETPQSDLTYNLRIGTTPGGSDILDATREGAEIGNVAGNTNWTLEDLEPGTYYWSVQTVDSGFAASEFAEEQSFTVEDPVFKVGEEFQVNSDNEKPQHRPSVSELDNGNFVVTWTSGRSWLWNMGTDGNVMAKIYDRSGNPVSDEFQVNTYTHLSQENSSVIGLKDGGFVVTWASGNLYYTENQDGSQRGIYAQRYDSHGNQIGDEFRVNTTTLDDQSNPSITKLLDGGFVITWSHGYFTWANGDVFGQRYDKHGNLVGSEFQINDREDESSHLEGGHFSSDVIGLSDGGFFVTWRFADSGVNGGGIYIKGKRYDNNGNPVGPEFKIHPTTDENQGIPSILQGTDGGFMVAWTIERNGDYVSYGQRYDSNGQPIGSKLEIPNSKLVDLPDGSYFNDQKTGAYLGDGRFVTTRSSRETGNVYADFFTVSNLIPNDSWIQQVGTNQPDSANGIDVDSMGNVYVVGTTLGDLVNPIQGVADPFLAKYDTEGNLIWLKQPHQGANFNTFTDVKVANNGSVYVIGYDDTNAEVTGGNSTLSKFDADGNPIWHQAIETLGIQDWLGGIETDADGNIYVAGLRADSEHESEAVLIKYDADGNEIWSTSLGKDGKTYGRSVAVDSQGNVYFAGTTTAYANDDSDLDGFNIFLKRYDPNGVEQWTEMLGTTAHQSPVPDPTQRFHRNVHVVIDNQDRIYVTGTTTGAFPGETQSGKADGFLASYQTDGTLNWTRQFGGSGEERISALAVDNAGVVRVGGYTDRAFASDGYGPIDGFIVSYDRHGNLLEQDHIGSSAGDEILGMATDPNNNLYIAGRTTGDLGGPNAGDYDAWVAKNPTNLSGSEHSTQSYFGEDLHTGGDRVLLESYPKTEQARSEFLANLVNPQTVDFEEFEHDSRPQVLDFGETTATLSYTTGDLIVKTLNEGATSPWFPTSGKNYLLSRNHMEFTIEFSEPQSAFGLNMTDAENGPFSMTLHREDGTTKNVIIPVEANHIDFSGSALFFGVKDMEQPFNAVTIHRPTHDGRTGLDELVIGDIKP